jgi:hypothetical protein
MLPISAQPTEQSLAETMIKLHGVRAIREAEALLHYNAALGDREGASKWMRVMVLIEFGDLTDAVSPAFPPAAQTNRRPSRGTRRP